MLTSAFRALVNNLFKKIFDINFMENEKSCQNINFFFPYKFSLTKLLINTLRTLVSISLICMVA